MDVERIKTVREGMDEAGIDALVCRLPENVLLLSGHWPLNGWTFLVFPLHGQPVCVAPHCDEIEAREELWEADLDTFLFGVLAAGNPYEGIATALDKIRDHSWKRVGYEGDFESVAPSWNAAETAIPAKTTWRLLTELFGAESLTDATDFLHFLRSRKTECEIEKLQRANAIAVFGLESFSENVMPGVSGIELVAAVEHAVMKKGSGYRGARRVRAFAQVASGAAETSVGFRPMEISTTRRMKEGDLALLELGLVADGYWSDRTRVRAAGEPTGQQSQVFELILKAQETAIHMEKAGMAAGELDEVAREIIREGGFDSQFPHVTGHGIGLRYHEPTPSICPGSELILEPGMVHTVEPGVYFPEMGGIRLEENVVVTESGCEVLGPFEKKL